MGGKLLRQGCVMSPWLFNVYMDAVMKELKMGMRRKRVRFLDEKGNGDCLNSCIQMSWLCVVSRRKI